MAAALLMMNMQGAVMAADKDQTIFRYSDKVPFALITDPCSKLPLEDLWNEFRTTTPFTVNRPFSKQVNSVAKFMTSHIGDLKQDDFENELSRNFICVGYDNDDMFPKAAILETECVEGGMAFKVHENITISRDCIVFHQAIGECTNINILLGGISDSILSALFHEMCNQLASFLDIPVEHLKNMGQYAEVVNAYTSQMEELQKDPETKKALQYFTIKDMVAMEENLIDTENLNHSSSTALGGSYTKEIAILTLAEGFKWIKHSLYGA